MSVLVDGCGWLVTYFLHSTVLLLVALAVVRCADRLTVPARELTLRVALFGGFATTALQAVFGWSPLSSWAESTWREVAKTSAVHGASQPTMSTAGTALPGGDLSLPSNGADSPTVDALGEWTLAASWPALVVAAWSVGVLVCVLGCLAGARRLRQALRDRRVVTTGPLRELLDGQGGRSVTLSVSPRIWSPLAFGALRPEICVPAEAMHALAGGERRSVLLHELAHLRGRDPLWLPLYHYLGAVAWFQPLHRLAVRQLVELAEFRCDDVAVRQGGSETSLASALLAVAEWGRSRQAGLGAVPVTVERSSPMASQMASPMASRPSLLGARVRRALDPSGRSAAIGIRSATAARFAAPGLAMFAWLLPAVGTAERGGDPIVAEPAAVESTMGGVAELATLKQWLHTMLSTTDESGFDAETAALVADIRSRLDRADRLHQKITVSQAPGSEPKPRKTQ